MADLAEIHTVRILWKLIELHSCLSYQSSFCFLLIGQSTFYLHTGMTHLPHKFFFLASTDYLAFNFTVTKFLESIPNYTPPFMSKNVAFRTAWYRMSLFGYYFDRQRPLPIILTSWRVQLRVQLHQKPLLQYLLAEYSSSKW